MILTLALPFSHLPTQYPQGLVHRSIVDRLGHYVPSVWLFLAFAEPPFRAMGFVSIGPSHLVAPALVAVGILFLALRGLPRTGSTLAVAAFVWLHVTLLVVWTIISVNSQRSVVASGMLIYYASLILALAIALRESPSRASWALKAIIAGAVVSLLAGFWWGQGFLTGRWVPAEGYNPSWFAAKLVAGCFAAAGIAAVASSRKIQWLSWSLAASFFLGVVLTQGRNALVALTVAFAILTAVALIRTIVGGRAGLLVRLSLVAVTALAVAGVLWYGVRSQDPLALARLQMLWEGDATMATAGRNERWVLAFLAASQGDLFLGVQNSKLAALHDVTLGVSPHNQYLTFLLETAGSMTALLIVFHIWLIRRSTKPIIRLFPAWLAIFLPLFAIGNDVVYYPYYWLLLATLIALIHLRTDQPAKFVLARGPIV